MMFVGPMKPCLPPGAIGKTVGLVLRYRVTQEQKRMDQRALPAVAVEPALVIEPDDTFFLHDPLLRRILPPLVYGFRGKVCGENGSGNEKTNPKGKGWVPKGNNGVVVPFWQNSGSIH
jgi:hypothetical protein